MRQDRAGPPADPGPIRHLPGEERGELRQGQGDALRVRRDDRHEGIGRKDPRASPSGQVPETRLGHERPLDRVGRTERDHEIGLLREHVGEALCRARVPQGDAQAPAIIG